ncbi:adenylate/guanylate cyclase domain-containing protein [Haloechinothrix sp. LS1_15]|uniref:adenylate/guanylate cyclase domain-containing protein n=1 Tax=Haloechinothrix sp. LS1_15 TaxID=2652248 RepID=UPI00294700D5|nr:adenylate/guanylate cyclase domain-containing protein [Haloechinothrix sp. LS1_15]MDV6013574.1 adenylate/guanylate cyclase domain-containing protein [Haloechinothrix sp. LS1_15]
MHGESPADRTAPTSDPGQESIRRRVERVLLGGERKYTRLQVAEAAGVSQDQSRKLWNALGFATAGDDEVVFTDGDIEALRLGEGLTEIGVISREAQSSVTRALGHHLSRLAEWQVALFWTWFNERPELFADEETVAETIEGILPVLEQLQIHVWRRHLAAYTGRALASEEDSVRSSREVVGFVDMVGYTRLSRRVDEYELSEVLDRFESLASDVIAQHGGRVVKMIGDEVLFVADNPADGAEIALRLGELTEQEPAIPELRTGLAYGRVLGRFGDVYGAVVNLAARLTSVARPGSVLADSAFAEALSHLPDYKLRTRKTVSVRGYNRLKLITLERAR